jgi:glyoxylase-like metal-dependent hydrolase (beta-lactamase superfamily II)
MIRLSWIALASAAALLVGNANAQQAAPPAPPARDFSKVEIKTTDLGHQTYMLQGEGGNITLAVGGDGVIMVDGEFAPLHDKIKAAIEAVTKQPVKFLVNTHYHGDHSGGNAPFAKDGAVVVADINVRKRLEAGTTNGLTGAKTPPAAAEALPAKTYPRGTTLKVKGRTAVLRHVPHAHTDGDSYVWFKDANVLSTGDTFTNGRYPNIDFANGGNIRGMIAATDIYLKLVNDGTKIVPGHGPLADKAKLAEYHTMLLTARDRMAKLVKAGKTEDEAIAAKPYADIDQKLGAGEQASKNWIRVVYNSLKKK